MGKQTKKEKADSMATMVNTVAGAAGQHGAMEWLASHLGGLMYDRDQQRRQIKALKRRVAELEGG